MDKQERLRRWKIFFTFSIISFVIIFTFIPIVKGITVQVLKNCLYFEAILAILCFAWLFCFRNVKG